MYVVQVWMIKRQIPGEKVISSHALRNLLIWKPQLFVFAQAPQEVLLMGRLCYRGGVKAQSRVAEDRGKRDADRVLDQHVDQEKPEVIAQCVPESI